MSRFWMRVASALFGLIVWGGAGSSFAAYSALDLGTLGGLGSTGASLNARGFVVGASATTADPTIAGGRAFLWKDGVMTDLGAPVGMWASEATDVNARGQVVGNAHPLDAPYSAFLYESGTMTLLPTLGGTVNRALAISDRGEIVGMSTLSEPPFRSHAYVWRNGEILDLGSLGGNSSATGINERGEVVGESNAGSALHAFLWRRGAMIDLGTLGGSQSQAADINNFGVVVGSATTASGEIHAFVWQDGHMTDLGTLGGMHSAATGINDRGQIVGHSMTAPTGFQHAFLWDHGTMTDLGTLGGPQSFALEIGGDGKIVGYSETGSGAIHAALWVPSRTEAGPTSLVPSLSSMTAASPNSGLSSEKPRAVISRNSSSTMTLSFVAPRAGDATVRLFDVSGRLVREIWNARPVSAGKHEVLIDGRGGSGIPLPSAVYYYQVGMRGWSLSGKICIAR